MKVRIAILSLSLAAFSAPLIAQAATVTSGPVQVSASVNALQQFNCTILQHNTPTDAGTLVTTMNFGQLARPVDATGTPLALASTSFFQVSCAINTSGKGYTLTQTGTALTAGTATLPAGAYVFTPLNITTGPGAYPAGGTVSARGSAVRTAAGWYAHPTGAAGVIQATYGITNDAANGATQFIAPDQAAGAYAGQVTWTLTINP